MERFFVAEEKQCARVCVRERGRVETQGVDKENSQVGMYIHEGERLDVLQTGRRMLYIVTLSLH